MSILFYDGVTPHPYSFKDLDTKPMGGTEATVARIANELSKTHTIRMMQRNGNQDVKDDPRVVITLRDAGHYKANKVRWPRAKHYLWLHDHVSGEYREHLYHHLHDIKDAHVILVSDYHKLNFRQNLWDMGHIKATRIYNPLADYCVKDDTPINENKLVFFSSPHKGLDLTFRYFAMIKRIDPKMELFIGNPGYLNPDMSQENGIHLLGALPHKEIIKHVRESLCTFYPNHVFPETFGLVMAESNAVGTPVLTHPLAAANEVLSHPKERLDVRNYKDVVDRVLAWKHGDRPTVKGNDLFKMENVIKDWKKLL